jgi:tRNA A58 N-methylase Trm61
VSEEKDYALGYSSEEEHTLVEQAALFEPLTADVFSRAGIRVGMSVLDIGCGVGDVSLLVARMVGPSGSVLGIDRGEESLLTARRRVSGSGVSNITFVATEIASFETDKTSAADRWQADLVIPAARRSVGLP